MDIDGMDLSDSSDSTDSSTNENELLPGHDNVDKVLQGFNFGNVGEEGKVDWMPENVDAGNISAAGISGIKPGEKLQDQIDEVPEDSSEDDSDSDDPLGKSDEEVTAMNKSNIDLELSPSSEEDLDKEPPSPEIRTDTPNSPQTGQKRSRPKTSNCGVDSEPLSDDMEDSEPSPSKKRKNRDQLIERQYSEKNHELMDEVISDEDERRELKDTLNSRRRRKRYRKKNRESIEEIRAKNYIKAYEKHVQGKSMTDIFPEFEEGKALPFLSMLYEPKPSSIYNKYKYSSTRHKGRLPSTIPDAVYPISDTDKKENEEKPSETKIIRYAHEIKDPNMLQIDDAELLKTGTLDLSVLTKTYAENHKYPPQEDECENLSRSNSLGNSSLQHPYQNQYQSHNVQSKNSKSYPAWRFGPNKIWYDMLGVGLDGMKNGEPFVFLKATKREDIPPGRGMSDELREFIAEKTRPKKQSINDIERKELNPLSKCNQRQISDSGQESPGSSKQSADQVEDEDPNRERYLYETTDWAKEIIIDSENPRELTETEKIQQRQRQKMAGWVPTADNRTMGDDIDKLAKEHISMLTKKDDIMLPSMNVQGLNMGMFNDQSNTYGGLCSNNIYPYGQPNNEFQGRKSHKNNHVRAIVKNHPKSLLDLDDDYEINKSKNWMNEIIWDSEYSERTIYPKDYWVDPNDTEIMLYNPPEPEKDADGDEDTAQPTLKQRKAKTEKKTAKILRSIGFYSNLVDDSFTDSDQDLDLDPWNFSNDIFYDIPVRKANKINKSGKLNLQHAVPAVELKSPCIPTYLTKTELRNWHRPILRFKWKPSENPDPTLPIELDKTWTQRNSKSNTTHYRLDLMPILGLQQNIKDKMEERKKERDATGGEYVFFMRNIDDLSMRDGKLYHYEYAEEYPPLLSQPGMCTILKSYYRKPSDDNNWKMPKIYQELGEPTPMLPSKRVFLGMLREKQTMFGIESKLLRAPCYPQKIKGTDFLIIRTQTGYNIRPINQSFSVGQICPLLEVYSPKSKKATEHTREFLEVYIYRLFSRTLHRGYESQQSKIKMEDIRKAFVTHSESMIRKRLKICAEFQRTGKDSNWWILKADTKIQTEDEIQQKVSPENCCQNYSMQAAQQRLKDMGYGDRNGIYAEMPDEEVDPDQQSTLDREVVNAPWNTCKAYLKAMAGLCLLQITGPADPTGNNTGFSYIRVPNKPTAQQTEKMKELSKQKGEFKKSYGYEKDAEDDNPDDPDDGKGETAEDKDLRKLPLDKAKLICKEYGVKESDLRNLKRWDVIDVVRQIASTLKKEGREHEMNTIANFSRGNQFSMSEHKAQNALLAQERFELQNRLLADQNDFSTDDDISSESDSEEDDDPATEALASAIDSLTYSGSNETEETREQRRLVQSLMEMKENDKKNKVEDKKKKEEEGRGHILTRPKRMVITRYFDTGRGTTEAREEIITKPDVIEFYKKIKETMNKDQIKEYLNADPEAREEYKKERRRIQEQLRRLRKSQEKTARDAEKGIITAAPISRNVTLDRKLTRSLLPTIGGKSAIYTGHTSETGKPNLQIKPPKPQMEPKPKPSLNPDGSAQPRVGGPGPPRGHQVTCSACGDIGHMKNSKKCVKSEKFQEWQKQLEREKLQKEKKQKEALEQTC